MLAALGSVLALTLGSPLLAGQDGAALSTLGGARERTPANPAPQAFEEVVDELEAAYAWLLANQKADGSFAVGSLQQLHELGFSVETFYAWQVAAHALACMALLEAPPTDARSQALERGLRWLCSTRAPKRGSSWDIDYVWGGLYGFVALVEAAGSPRFEEERWQALLEGGAAGYLEILRANQIPSGGWAYYDDPVFSRRPKWGTSFSTALVLPALARGEELGWVEDFELRQRATRYVTRCALPSGAWEYDLNPVPRLRGGEHINQTKGSLARTQVCNWGLAASGVRRITPERLREGLTAFFHDHRFLDVAYMKPRPHEAYYANSGYFYLFGHYYAALAIEALPEAEREGWHRQLRPHLTKVQRRNGSATDFLFGEYNLVAGTAFLALALEHGRPVHGRPVER
ncbi:MAG: hypothetical protein WD226_03790 [Planctomycetota bacterium]